MSETSSKPDLSFLKEKEWTSTGFGFDQLSQLFLREFEDEKTRRPDLKGDSLYKSAKNSFIGSFRKLLGSGNQVGQGVSWGLGPLIDYLGAKAKKQLDSYKALRSSDPEKAKKKVGSEIRIRVDGKGNEILEALDTRDKYKSGKPNPNFGMPYPPSSYFTNFVGVWLSTLQKKQYIVYSALGGEISGDDIVNPKCPICGKVSYDKKCDGVIVRQGKNQACPGIRNNILSDVMGNVGKLANFAMKVSAIKDKEGQITGYNVDFSNSTVIGGGKALDLKFKDEERLELEGEMTKWIPKSRLITGASVTKDWEKLKATNRVVFWPCNIYQMDTKPNDAGNRVFWASDGTMSISQEGIKLIIPDHVWYFNVKGKIAEHSWVLVAGILNRREKWDPKANDGKGGILEGQFLSPFVEASAIVPLEVVTPKVSEKEVESVESDSFEIVDSVDKKEEVTETKEEVKPEKQKCPGCGEIALLEEPGSGECENCNNATSNMLKKVPEDKRADVEKKAKELAAEQNYPYYQALTIVVDEEFESSDEELAVAVEEAKEEVVEIPAEPAPAKPQKNQKSQKSQKPQKPSEKKKDEPAWFE